MLTAVVHSTTLKRAFSLLITVFLGYACGASAMDDVAEARNLLKKMASANREIDYRGVFTYEHAGTMKSVRITHAVVDGLEYEQLLYLNGPKREVVRLGVPAECKSAGDEFFSGVPVPSQFSSQLEANYELFLKGEDRVAGRDVSVIHVVPRDGMRYGYILSVDRASGLLLQSLLVGPKRRVLERFQFVDIDLEPDPARIEALVVRGGQKPSEEISAASNCAAAINPEIGWKAQWLPSGFSLVKSSASSVDDASMVFTDGLSFVSVFINSSAQGAFPPIQAQRGATVAQMAMLNHNGQEFQICVVGEVPAAAAEKIAQSIVPGF